MAVIDIWAQCNGIRYFSLLNQEAWRIIESQEITATRKLVDSLDEQIILEEMIEANKPPILHAYLDYHPLLYTPFRYPPLKFGSRFGKKTEASLWYGSLTRGTAMAEKAFYKLNFLRASAANYENVLEGLTAFTTQIKTKLELIDPPFSQYSTEISSPNSYATSQLLGTSMRNAGVLAFNFLSARDPNQGANIALFSPEAFLHKKPNANSFESWQCIANKNRVDFIRSSSLHNQSETYTLDQFMLNKALPFPAN